MRPPTLRRLAHEACSCLCGATALGVVLFVVGTIIMMTLLPVAASATVLSALLTPTGAQPFALSPTGAVATSAALTAALVTALVAPLPPSPVFILFNFHDGPVFVVLHGTHCADLLHECIEFVTVGVLSRPLRRRCRLKKACWEGTRRPT